MLLGPDAADELIPWEDAATATLLSGDTSPPLAKRLAAFDVAIAYTRNPEVIGGLGRLIAPVVPHDPQPPAGGPHASEWLAAPLRRLGISIPTAILPLAPTVDEREEARRRLGLTPGFLAIHPGSGSPAKNWPADRFLRLAEVLSADRPWLLALGPAEVERGMVEVHGAVVAREWPVRLLLAAVCDAGLYVGNDSGVTHLAAASGARTVALFGPTDPALWAPVGERITVVLSPDGTMCGLPVDRVVAAV